MSEQNLSNRSIDSAVKDTIEEYIKTLGDENIHHLHDLLLEQVEPPLLEMVMKKVNYNQSKAAKLLGLSRGTLRKKLKQYFGNKYCHSHSAGYHRDA